MMAVTLDVRLFKWTLASPDGQVQLHSGQGSWPGSRHPGWEAMSDRRALGWTEPRFCRGRGGSGVGAGSDCAGREQDGYRPTGDGIPSVRPADRLQEMQIEVEAGDMTHIFIEGERRTDNGDDGVKSERCCKF
jgi:hypothetical protein